MKDQRTTTKEQTMKEQRAGVTYYSWRAWVERFGYHLGDYPIVPISLYRAYSILSDSDEYTQVSIEQIKNDSDVLIIIVMIRT